MEVLKYQLDQVCAVVGFLACAVDRHLVLSAASCPLERFAIIKPKLGSLAYFSEPLQTTPVSACLKAHPQSLLFILFSLWISTLPLYKDRERNPSECLRSYNNYIIIGIVIDNPRFWLL